MERFQKDGMVKIIPPIKTEWLYKRCWMYRWYLHNIKKYHWMLFPEDQYLAKRDQALGRITDVAGLFKRLADSKGFSLAVVSHPLAEELIKGQYSHGLEAVLDQIAGQGIYLVNLMDYYSRRIGRNPAAVNRYYWPQDLHHNAPGYRLFAEGVLDGLTRGNLSCGS